MPELIILFIVLFLFSTAVAYFKTPQGRGKLGEWKVARKIGKTIEGEQYVLNDYIIEENNKSSQIDHIVINASGVFVIETKNYAGRIYGEDNQLEWTQVLNYGKVKNKFYNPVKQNETHVYRIKQVIKDMPVYSIVIFIQNNTQYVKSKMILPLKYLKKYLKSGPQLFSKTQMENAYNALLTAKSDMNTKEHVQNIHRQQQALAMGICPRCGGRLEKRNSAYGVFYGCSNYPRCTFTKK